MANTLRNLVSGIVLTGVTACTPLSGILPERMGQFSLHPVTERCIEGLPVRISHNSDESWRLIRIESPDAGYVEAEDYVTDNDGRFDILTFSGVEFNHPLRKYHNLSVMEEIYRRVKEGRIARCS